MINPLNWLRNNETLFLLGKLKKDLLKPLWGVRYQVMQGVRKIDLCDVTYVDTVGLALLVHLVNIRKKEGVRVILSNVHDNVCSLVKIYNLPQDLFPTDFKNIDNNTI